MKIAFASGKGGTGKTLLATSTAWALARRRGGVTYVDADVEEPNGHLFLRPEIASEARHAVAVPRLVPGRCDGCRLCQTHCAFHALVVAGRRVMVFEELCHSCGVCASVCPERALEETPREIGTIRWGRAGALAFVDGVLDVGQARSAPLVAATIAAAPEGLAVIDAPPGTSCPVLAVVDRADLVVLVTEPTPFGLHDLQLAVELCRTLGRPMAAVLNRSDLGHGRVRAWLDAQSIPVLAEIPFDREVARAGAEGRIAAESVPAVATAVEALIAFALGTALGRVA